MRTYRGFSLLELVVVIVLVALLMVVAIARLMAVQADAERVTVETVVGTLRSALGMKVAEHIVQQNITGLGVLAGSNPMDLLAQLPPNYLGAFNRPEPSKLKNAHWYFDRREGFLVYLVRNKENFSGGLANPPRARFGVEVVYADRNGNGRFDAGVDVVEGLRLSVIEAYAWMQ